jgi:hypothetical protein
MQQTACNMQQTACNRQHATRSMPAYAAQHMQHVVCSMQHATLQHVRQTRLSTAYVCLQLHEHAAWRTSALPAHEGEGRTLPRAYPTACSRVSHGMFKCAPIPSIQVRTSKIAHACAIFEARRCRHGCHRTRCGFAATCSVVRCPPCQMSCLSPLLRRGCRRAAASRTRSSRSTPRRTFSSSWTCLRSTVISRRARPPAPQ